MSNKIKECTEEFDLDEDLELDEGAYTLYKQTLHHIRVDPTSGTDKERLGKIGKFGERSNLSNDAEYKKALADAHEYGKTQFGGKYEITHMDPRNHTIRGGSVAKVRREMAKSTTNEEFELDEAMKPLPRRHFFKSFGVEGHGIAHVDDNHWKIENNRPVAHTKDPEVVAGWKRDLAAKSRTNEEFELDEEKIPVDHVVDAVGRVLGQKSAVSFLGHLRPGTEKHTSWDKANSALTKQGVQPQHIARIASHVKPAQYEEFDLNGEIKVGHKVHIGHMVKRGVIKFISRTMKVTHS